MPPATANVPLAPLGVPSIHPPPVTKSPPLHSGVPAHATSGILMGYFFGLAKGDQLRWGSYSRRLFVYGYLSAALFHAVWDAIAFQRDLVSLFFLGVASVLAVLIRKIFLQKIFE